MIPFHLPHRPAFASAIGTLRCGFILAVLAAGSLTAAYPEAEWVELIDPELSHWRGYRRTEAPVGWKVEDGTLSRVFWPGQHKEEFADGGGDLMTRARFGDFELEFEFNVEPDGNSGVMYRVSEAASRAYWTGPEYQILERADRKSDPAFHFSGANYALQGPDRDVSLGANAWNRARIRVEHNRVEHWLNGEKVVEYTLRSEVWNTLVKESKFRDRPGYGAHPVGHIVFQDHGAQVAFRNVRIRALDGKATCTDGFSNSPWWNLLEGDALDHWRTWLGIPHASVEGLDLAKDAAGNYIQAIGYDDDPKGVFQHMELDGEPVLRISGEIYGALTSQQAFDNFHLRLEYRWGTRKWAPRLDHKRNSGVLYYATGDIEGPFPEQSFMRALECQIQEGETGDLFLLFAPKVKIPVSAYRITDRQGERQLLRYDPQGTWKTLPDEESGIRVLKSHGAEHGEGEWNRVDVICVNGNCVHLVNGEVVMSFCNPVIERSGETHPLRAGKIQLQSEGAEIFYRNVALRMIDRFPEDLE